jgi:DNA-binding CsgD family transcriptional regulator/tetratricopeptide (TPR) repeat protein
MTLYERQRLLEQLSSLQRAAHREPGRLALVSGEAGAGKTSVVEALCAAQRTSARVLWGSCDAITPPRAFAPLADIANKVGGPLARALSDSDRDGVLQSFLALVRRHARPTIVVLDDLHWADDATLDLLRVLGRHLRELPVLVIGTYREEEVGADHPLRLALGDLPAALTTHLEVPPLSKAAIRDMVGGKGIDPDVLHAMTAGNPFFATEVIASGTDRVPRNVRDAVLARAARLSPGGGKALRAASILGRRWAPSLLKELTGCDDDAIDECCARGMLREVDGLLAFRHDIAQQAVKDALRPAVRMELNRRALDLLRSGSTEVDPARLARHAVDAEDADAILDLAPAAAERARVLGAHRESAGHYEAALRVAERMDPRRHAELLEAHATECRVTDRIDAAVVSQTAAIDRWHSLGDIRREGDCIQALSLMLWLSGSGDRALQTAEQAVTLLESQVPHGLELARAYSSLAQRLENGGDDKRARATAMQALRLANTMGDERVAVHALTTIGLAEVFQGIWSGWSTLEQSATRAKAAGLEEDAARALINLVESGRDLRRYDQVDRYRDEAVAWVEEHDLVLYRRRLNGDLAELALERGRWDEAAERAEALLAESHMAPVIRAKGLTVIGRLRARRGDANPWAPLDEAWSLVGPAGDSQDVVPTAAARTEAAWLQQDAARAAEEARRGLALATEHPDDTWLLGEAAYCAWKVGLIEQLPAGSPQPYLLHAAGRHRDAAIVWERLGCPYHQAQALADSSHEADLRQSLTLLHALDAQPLVRIVRERLRAIGARSISRGPRRSTRRHPAQLTERQVEVLAQLRDGRSNAEIAKRLVVSPKTVDHHVSAILRKLGVHDRVAAARLDIKDGEPPAQT